MESNCDPVELSLSTKGLSCSPTSSSVKKEMSEKYYAVDISSATPRSRFNSMESDHNNKRDTMIHDLNEMVFIPPDEGTPAAEALAANAALKVSKVTKRLQKLGRIKGRPKMKSLNIIKKINKRTKKKRKKKHFSRNFKGKVIDGVHELYTLTAGIMLGIRNVVGRSYPREYENLNVMDFNYVENIAFPPKGNSKPPFITPPHALMHTFKFKTYAPKVFRRIREFFGIDPGSFMLSVCGNYNFLEFISNSKSGQFFFYSHDGKYMIKTQTKEENKFLKHILPHYFKYLTENPHSFLVRILAMHRVKMNHLRRKVHFVIMTSVFDTPEQIHTIYDLKGSLIGRRATEKEKSSGGVLKDLDLVESHRKFHLGEKKSAFIEQLSKDATFLASLNIMDYSLLIGIHDRTRREHFPQSDEDAQSQPNPAVVPDSPSHRRSVTPFRQPVVGSPSGGSQRKTFELDIKDPNNMNSDLHVKDITVGIRSRGNSHAIQDDDDCEEDEVGDEENGNEDGDENRNDNDDVDSAAEDHGEERNDDDDSYCFYDADGFENEHFDDGDSVFGSDSTHGDEFSPKRRISLNKDNIAEESDSQQDQENTDGVVEHKDEENTKRDTLWGRLSHIFDHKSSSESGKKKSGKRRSNGDGKGAMGAEGSDVSRLFRSDRVLLDSIAKSRSKQESLNENRLSTTDREGTSLSSDRSPSVEELKSSRSFNYLSSMESEIHSPSVIYAMDTFGPGNCNHLPWTSRADHGINSREEPNTRGNEIYYCGVIDILQEYNISKRTENFFKGFIYDRSEISAVDAHTYAKRFIKFMEAAVD